MRHIIQFVATQDIFLVCESLIQGLGSGESHTWYTIEPDSVVKITKGKEYLAWVYDDSHKDFFVWEKSEEGNWKQFDAFNLEELRELARDELIKITDEQVEPMETKRSWPGSAT